MKNSKVNSILILFLTCFILFFLLKDDFPSVIENLINSNHMWIIMAIGCYLIYFLLEQASLYFLTKNIKDKIDFGSILKMGVVTKFFNGITPLSSGGQPYQVYELHKKGVPVSKGTSIVIQNYILFQISLIIFALISLIVNKLYNLFEFYPFLWHLTLIGFFINIIILIFLLVVGFSNRFNQKTIQLILNFLSRIKIIKAKDKEAVNKKWTKICNDYHEGGMMLLNNKKTFLLCFIFQFTSSLFYYIIPVFIIKALYISDIHILSVIAASAYTFLMSCYIPLPGASGGVEFAFISFFGNFTKGATLTSLLIIYRFVTYYLPCSIGGLMLVLKQNKKKNQ